MTPLAGLRVIEATVGIAGPMAACRLADLGANVVKIERGAGDWMRAAMPRLADGEMSAAFFALNRGKRSVLLSDDAAEARRQLASIAASADVLIVDETFDDVAGPNVTRSQRLIVLDISALGRKGPLAGKPGSELGAQAMAGYTRYVSAQSQPPARLGADVAGASTAIFAAQAILAALISRSKSGHGQRIELSLLNSLLSMKTVHLAAQSDPDKYEGPRVGGAYDPPERGWATADAPITFAFGGAVGAEGRPGWTQFIAAMGLSHMLNDPRFDKTGRQTTGLGPKARELKSEYEVGFRKHASADVVANVRKFGGFASAYLTHAELLNEPQVAALDVVKSVESNGGTQRALSFPVRFAGTKVPLHCDAPRLGQHTEEILAELASSKSKGSAKSPGKRARTRVRKQERRV